MLRPGSRSCGAETASRARSRAGDEWPEDMFDRNERPYVAGAEGEGDGGSDRISTVYKAGHVPAVYK